MSFLRRNRWFAAAVGITVFFSVISASVHKGAALTAFSDLSCLALAMAALGVALERAITAERRQRNFWALTALGFLLSTCNQAAWTYFDLTRPQPILDPSFFDIVLFFHAVPLIAAIVWRPDLEKRGGSGQLSLRNLLMLLAWWVFLYAFIVFPHQYVALNVSLYNLYYDRLFLLENILWLSVLGLASWTSFAGWRRLYLHFLGAGLLYTVGSALVERAAMRGAYYQGSIYDLPLVATFAWMTAAALQSRSWNLQSRATLLNQRWKKILPRLAMLALLSLPILGLWTALFDQSAAPTRVFRIFTVLAAMLLLGAFVFLRQYMQDQALMALLQESRRGYESQKRLQSELVQKEKLASLGNLVAGAARDINHPLSAVMGFSEQLWAKEQLTGEQNVLLRKIVAQAGRTRDLVADLLSFAQQSPTEKTPVDVNFLLQRAKQVLELRRPSSKVRVGIAIDSDFPRVQGNANQLFQSFVEIIENAMDALDENGAGALEITAQRQGDQAVLQFSDSGPGIREPQRVFDPFYTTKPVGKGTGLGLSVVYGVIQDHSGRITCRNKPEGGAVFEIRLPAEPLAAAKVAGVPGD